MQKLKMHSPDLTRQNIARIRELFPGCVTEARGKDGDVRLSVDFDLLRQELSDSIVEGPQERYHLDWPGKREALLTANAPIAKTLRPCREESVDFDTTKNLFIEGDNLDALKLLQETYLGKVKMIYIDPPYNTGNDFIYEDDFAENTEEFLRRSNQKDEDGNLLSVNTQSNGRFHSDWLSMIYSRLRLMKKLLSDEGLLVVSVDENELKNLLKVLDEIFSENNFLFCITVLCNPKGRSQDKYIANCHEYLVGYSKSFLEKGSLNIPKTADEIEQDFPFLDGRGRFRELELRNTHREFGKHNRPNLYYPFFVNDLGDISLEEKMGFSAVFPDWEDGFEGCWTWGINKSQAQLGEIVTKKVNGRFKIFRKNYALDDNGEASKQVKSIWFEKAYHTEKGQKVFNELFNMNEKIFQSPKAVDLIRQLLLMSTQKREHSLIIDFFSGSATTAHAVLQLNAEDGGNRQFIMVQLPEPCKEDSVAFQAGYKTIAEIGKERIRRAGNKILESECHEDWNRDIGFRVLKVDTSNMADVYYAPDGLQQANLSFYENNIKPDRTPEDLLFQVMLDWGVDLTFPIRRETVRGKTVFLVDENAILACFDDAINEDLLKELTKFQPLRAVFRDSGYISDSVKINAEQIFKQMSPGTEVKSL